MRYLTIIFLFLFVGTNQRLFSQKIQSQLDVKWKEKEIYVSGFCGGKKVPYLVLKYINTSNDSLYFYEVNDSYMVDDYYHQLIDDKPFFLISPIYRPLCDSIGISRIGFREPENEYNVYIGNVPKTDWWGWLITDKQIKQAPHGCDLPRLDIMYKLNKVADRLTQQEYYLTPKDSMAQLCDFCYPDKHYVSDSILFVSNEEWDSLQQSFYARFYSRKDSLANPEFASIIYKREYDSRINDIQRNFITIPPHGIYSKEYDLTHFKIVGGTYNFIYTPSQTDTSFTFLRPDVEVPLKNPDDDESNYFTYHFPAKFKGYKLYLDKIKGTRVKIEIK